MQELDADTLHAVLLRLVALPEPPPEGDEGGFDSLYDDFCMLRYGCKGIEMDPVERSNARAAWLWRKKIAPAAHLVRCACVCRLWYAGAVHDELWRSVLLRTWGAATQQLLDWQAVLGESVLPHRAQYMCTPSRPPACALPPPNSSLPPCLTAPPSLPLCLAYRRPSYDLGAARCVRV
jgi:hypothetical protein